MLQLTTLTQPHRSFYWTAPVSDSSEMTTEDPLGLDYVAQQVGLLLLPGLTTRSTRAQAYAMVLYGLDLVHRATEEFDYPPTDEARRELFERWERFWALATLEYRQGPLPRGDWDAMRGVRGATKAWRETGDKLPLDFQLISRQLELGHLGAYLVPLRRSGLVVDGGIRPTPAAMEIIANFWDEAGANKHTGRYEEFAKLVLEQDRTKFPRKHVNLTLSKVGERSRLLALIQLHRTEQQQRLYAALFERARDPHTFAVSHIVESATRVDVLTPREILDGAIAGQFGPTSPELQALLITARAFGDFMQLLLGSFDRVYSTIDLGGWIVDRAAVVQSVFGEVQLSELQDACRVLLDAPAVAEIRRFPMHGAACLRLAEYLVAANASDALDLLLTYHGAVQRDRRRGASWIREQSGKLTLGVTSYTARPDSPRYPSFKLDVVRTLLTDLGRLPFEVPSSAEGAQ
ncbi:MAG: hypothetical protein H6718_07750 [Polyangiaceae bacterium]|nr:hypothetical protein [Polyangiaceae bacterium]